MEYDVIVAGAGPAGSTAARECASRGLSVLLLDKESFPRDKPCGGGVNVRAARLLPFDLTGVVERTIYGMHVSVKQSRSFTRYSTQPLTYLTQRRHLDTFLVEQAVRAGAVLRERAPIQRVDISDGRTLVRAGAEIHEGRTLVAADGANGPTARLAGVRLRRWRGIALEANVGLDEGSSSRWSDVFAIDAGSVPGGYGWLFPKGDHVNIGVGGWSSTGPSLRRLLDQLARFYGFDPAAFWGLRGHPLPVTRLGARLMHRNIIAVGDAAGLVDPLTGEGIFSAIWSGSAAARHIAAYLDGSAGNLEGYQRDVDRELMVDLHIAGQLRDLFHLTPPAWTELLRRSPRVWTAVCRLLTGELTYTGIKRRVRGLPLAIDLGADLVRAGSYRIKREGVADTLPPHRYMRRWVGGDGG